MKYKRFIIDNYRAINHIELTVNRNVIPMIGLNESGKTSVLHAILAFDRTKDNVMAGKHLDTKNKYSNYTDRKDCSLVAHIEIEDENEWTIIAKDVGVNVNDSVYDWLRDKFNNNQPIVIKRILHKGYEIIEDKPENISDTKLAKLVRAIERRLPNILYFDDFTDRVPESVDFDDEYINNGKYKSKNREWQELIEEIYKRAFDSKLTLSEFMTIDDDDDMKSLENDVNQILNEEIITEWQKLKSEASSLADDKRDLKLSILFKKPNRFIFKVQDSESGKDRQFNISERSKGFQWFFNFITKLKFNPKYKTHPKNAIYLLDEPGSYLHSTAQVELLKKLCEFGKDNTIIYCTHSQYLLDPDVINIGSIRIVEKKNGEILIKKYGESRHSEVFGALTPLVHALQLKFGFYSNLKKCILTEGITDYYFYKMFFEIDNVSIIPGKGCKGLAPLISILISACEDFLVILDNDQAGRESADTYGRHFNKSFLNNYYIYDFDGKANFVLEDILSQNDKNRILNYTNCKDIKNAITELYFKDESEKEKIKSELDEETTQNIKKIKKAIDDHFNKSEDAQKG